MISSVMNMSIKIGGESPQKLYYGTTPVTRVYMGSTLVWSTMPGTTSVWGASLAEAANGTGRANILFVGDSYFEGVGLGSSGRPNRFIDRLVDALRAEHDIAGSGLGYVPTRFESNPGFPAATGTGTSNYSNSENYQARHGAQPTNARYLEWTVVGDSVDLLHATSAGAGSLAVSIDGGGSIDSFSLNSATSYANVRHYSLGTSGSHNFRITSTGTTGVDGIVVYDGDYTAGISYWDCARGGSSSEHFQPSTGASLGWVNGNFHLVIESLYGNDFLDNLATPATAASRFQARVSRYKSLSSNPTIVTILYWDLANYNTANSLGYTHGQYRDAIRAVATTEEVTILDLSTLYGTVSSSYLTLDNIHPNAAGHQLIADCLLDTLEALG